MKKQIKTLVLTNGNECTLRDLQEAREYAIEQYYKAQTRKNNAEIRMKEAWDIIEGLEGRIRLLKMI